MIGIANSFAGNFWVTKQKIESDYSPAKTYEDFKDAIGRSSKKE